MFQGFDVTHFYVTLIVEERLRLWCPPPALMCLLPLHYFSHFLC
jgi:hypothetical protein